VLEAASRGRSARAESVETRRSRWPAALSAGGGALALAAAALPLVIAAVAIAVQRPGALSDGDQAADELALIRSTHFAQLVGNYSRFEWNHPGPAWFYAMDPFYVPLGGHTWATYVAVLALHAVIAALVVAAVWRWAGPLVALVTAGLVLLYVRTLGESVFRFFWPPYSVMLPMLLLFVLAAAGAAGSTPALVGALIAGSYVVQLHVGTVPIVGAVIVAMVAIRLATRSLGEPAATGPAARFLRPALTAGGGGVLVLMWVPVAVDELTGHPGNLTKLFEFFRTPHEPHPYGAAVSALGRLLEVSPLRDFPTTFGPESAAVPPSRLLAVLAFAAASAALAALALRLRDRFALALGLLLVLALPVVTVAITRIVGPLYPYLLVWVTTLPLLLAVGWTALVARARPWARAPRPLAGAVAAALCVAVVALAAGRTAGFERLPPALGDQADPETAAAWAITEAALASEPRRSVRVVVADDRWIMASGLVLQLQKQGWTVTADRDHAFIWGSQTEPTGTEAVELVVVSAGGAPGLERQRPDLRPISHTADAELLVGHAPGAGS